MNRKITALLLLIILLLQLSSCGTDSPFRRNTGNRKEDMSGQQEEPKEDPSENPGEDPGGQGEQPPDNGDYTVPLDGVGGLPPSSLTWINVPAAIEQTAASVVKLDVYDKHGTKVASGTAFAAIEEGLLLTAYHVIEKMDHANASGEAGLAFTVTEILASDAENDIAILKLPDDVKLPVIAIGGEPLRGDQMAVIGSQAGVMNLVTIGNYNGRWESDSGEFVRFLFSTPVASGCSGAPLMNSIGYVVGVVSGTYDGAQNLNIVVPMEDVVELYNQYMEDEGK